uniref:Peptidase S74 domain-containing protein n=1 Tax=Panagrolaimus davidi TaxID=227884 RepID=A0A914QVU8_9BILA
MEVIADKGFNYNFIENAFINQKKNHFQITVNINLGSPTKPAYFCVNGILKEITDFKLALCGIKAESPTVEIGLKQSNSERKPINYEPTSVQIGEKQQIQIKVPRLHFSETTLNNARKAGKPNDQKFFQLAIKLQVYASDGSFCIVQAYQSEKVIVRATHKNHQTAFQAGNPAQFDHHQNRSSLEPNSSAAGANGAAGERLWQNNKNLIYTYSPVSIGTDQQFPGALLSIGGNIVSTGNWTKPSDRRVKENIVNYDTHGATDRLAQVQIVGYSYKPEFADEWGLDESNRHRIGVIAQQVADVLPDAVKENGEYLTVDENRIFMETVAAAQELYRVTGNLESKIGQVEKISIKLAKFAKNNKQKFGGSTISGLTTYLDENKSTVKDEDGKSIYSISSTSPSSCNGSPTHHRRYNQQQQQDMCSSKFTQYTVTFLIGVMALCLLSMCSLYILDWYRRISNDPHENFIPTFNYSSDDTSIGNLIEQKYELPLSWLPETQPLAPLLASKCGLTRQCPVYCCENEIGKDGKNLQTNRSITYPDMALITNVDKNCEFINNGEYYTAALFKEKMKIDCAQPAAKKPLF